MSNAILGSSHFFHTLFWEERVFSLEPIIYLIYLQILLFQEAFAFPMLKAWHIDLLVNFTILYFQYEFA
jgi:hypothetical protein